MASGKRPPASRRRRRRASKRRRCIDVTSTGTRAALRASRRPRDRSSRLVRRRVGAELLVVVGELEEQVVAGLDRRRRSSRVGARPTNDRRLSPDSAWLATATSGAEEARAASGPRRSTVRRVWSVTVESPARNTVVASGAGSIVTAATAGRRSPNSSVSAVVPVRDADLARLQRHRPARRQPGVRDVDDERARHELAPRGRHALEHAGAATPT